MAISSLRRLCSCGSLLTSISLPGDSTRGIFGISSLLSCRSVSIFGNPNSCVSYCRIIFSPFSNVFFVFLFLTKVDVVEMQAMTKLYPKLKTAFSSPKQRQQHRHLHLHPMQ